MIKFKILELAEGASNLLAVAKSKAEAQISEFAGELGFHRTWPMGDFLVRMQANRYSNTEDWVVRLWLTGGAIGPAPILFFASTGTTRVLLSAQTTHGFKLSPNAGKYSWDNIEATPGLTALDTSLSFKVTEPPFIGEFMNNMEPKRLFKLFNESVKAGNWFAIEHLHMLIERSTFTRNGSAFTPIKTQCLISPWDETDADFKILIGKWIEPPVAMGDPFGVMMTYSGVVVSAKKLLALYNKNAPTGNVFFANLSDPELEAQSADSFTALSAAQPPYFGGFGQAFIVRRIPPVSPYFHPYDIVEVISTELSAGIAPHYTTEQSRVLYGHRLSYAGQLVEEDVDMLAEGQTMYDFQAPVDANPGSSSIVWTPFSCDLGFFDGERMVKIGTHSYTGGATGTGSGGATGNAGTYTEQASIPLHNATFELNDSSNRYTVYTYCQDHKVAISAQSFPLNGADPYVGKIVSQDQSAYSHTLNFNPSSTSTDRSYNQMQSRYSFWDHQAIMGSPTGPTIFTHDNEVSILTNWGPEFLNQGNSGLVGYPVPQGKAIPPLFTGSGVTGLKTTYWYRAGSTGVFMAHIDPNDLPASLDMVAWGATLTAIDNGTPINEAGAQAVLDRILSKVKILANNFASPALIPVLIGGGVSKVIATR